MLLERDRALSILRDGLALAAAGSGRIVVVAGEAGIGKTTLVRSFLDEVSPGTRVFRAACEDLSIAEPMGPLRDLAREAHWEFPQDLAATGSRIAAFSGLLEHLTGTDAATLVVVEDVHWADDATVDFLRFLGRRLEGRRVLLVLTARDDEEQGQLQIRRSLDGIPPDRVMRLALEPLSRAAVTDLARAAGKNPATVFEATRGNPLFVTELLRGDGTSLPPTLKDAVLARADRLPAAARGVLSAIAIFPRRAEAELVRLVRGEGSDFDADLEDCIAAGLLEDDGEFVAFRHELARRAVEVSLSTSVRRALNARLLALLREREDVSNARLLHHAEAAGDRDAVAHLAPKAAEEASQAGALREAADYWDLAVEASRRAPPDNWVDLLSRCAWANYLVTRDRRAIELQTEALAICKRSGDVLQEGDFYRRLSRFHWNLGDTATAQTYSQEAIRTLADHPGPELAMAHSTVAQLAMLNYDHARVPEHATAAMDLAERFDRPDILSHALNNLAMSYAQSNPSEGRRLMQRSLEIALAIEDPDHSARAYVNWAFLEYYSLDFPRSAELARQGLAYCSAHELDGYASYLFGTLALAQLHQGEWDEALISAQTAFRPHFGGVSLIHSFPGACALVWLAMRRGEGFAGDAQAYVEHFVSRTDELQRVAMHAAIAGEMAWLGQRDRTEALTLLDRAIARAADPGFVPFVLLWAHLLDPDRDLPCSPLLPKPVASQLSGDWRGAAAAWADLGAPYEQALTLSMGDTEGRHQALAILRGLGAEAAVAAVLRDMRAEGVSSVPRGPRASTKANPLGLTQRQLEVLRKLNDGLSNAEIAERLFVSPKTVDHHVSAILNKLEVSSRGEAASKARKEGLI